MDELVTPFKSGMKYGLYLGLALIVLTLVGHYTGWQDIGNPGSESNQIISIVSLIVGFAFTYAGIRYLRENNEGFMTLGEGMSTAIFIGIISGIIGAVFMYIFASFIMPDMAADMLEQIDLDEMSEEEAEITQVASEFMTSPSILATISFVGSIVLSLIYGLIASVILKKG